jgi:phosphoribosylaminoimidazolecarboxamide formyltransferase/IMP cyclohydrolase
MKSARPRKPKRQHQVETTPAAIISVFCKDGAVELGQGLNRLGLRVISSGGTAKTLAAADVKCVEVSKVTGFPEMLDGRVKTIHPVIAAGILAMNTADHTAQLKQRGIARIKLVCVNLYPFANTVASGASHTDIIEKIDIGGVLLLRAAAKNADQGVVVLCDPADYALVLKAMEENAGEVPLEMRMILAQKVFDATAVYDAAIATYLAKHYDIEPTRYLALKPVRELRKAENDYQGPSTLCRDLMAPGDDPLAWDKWRFVEGNPGHVNLCGADAALKVMSRLCEACQANFNGVHPYITIACKHGNPCGLGVDWKDPCLSIERAMIGDKDAVMGAEIMCNFRIDGEEAIRIHTVLKSLREKVKRDLWGVDVICAAEFSEAAISLLSTRSTGRHLLANLAMVDPFMAPQDCEVRLIRGGALIQKPANFIFTPDQVQEWIGFRRLEPDELLTQLISWIVAWEGVSNSVALAKDLALIGTGLGQQDRRCAAKLALMRAKDAGHDPRGSFFGSDGFFPFANSKPGELPEAIELLTEAGCIGGVVPADGKRWNEVRDFCRQHNLLVAALDAKLRGFAKH